MARNFVYAACVAAVFAAGPSLAQASGGAPSGMMVVTPGSGIMRSDAALGLNGSGAVSAVAAKPLHKAYGFLHDKDWTDAIATCKEASLLIGLTPYDQFMISYFLGVAYRGAGDAADAAASYEIAANSTAAPADLRGSAILSAVQLHNDAHHYDKVIVLVKLAEDTGVADEKVHDLGAIAADALGDDKLSEAMAGKAVADAAKTGAQPARLTYQVKLVAEAGLKDMPGEIRTLETLCNLYGGKNAWGNLIDLTIGSLTGKGDTLEAAMLYTYRLRLVTAGAMIRGDYILMGQLALLLGAPGDAERAMHAGLDAGVLAGDATAAGILADADKRAAAERDTLAHLEDLAAKAKTGDADVAVGEAYFGYGRYRDAARLAQAGLAKGGRRMAEAKMLLGASLAMTGDNDASLAAFSSVGGDPSVQTAAHLWVLYATRKYDQPVAAAPHS